MALIAGRSPEQVDEIVRVREEIWDRYVSGESQRTIAAAVGKSASWVNETIGELFREAQQSLQQTTRGHLEKLLHGVNLVRRAAWIGWRRSLEDKVQQLEEETTGGDSGGGSKSATRTEGQSGNPQFLRVLLECDKREAVLRGIEKPLQPVFNVFQKRVSVGVLIQQIKQADAKVDDGATPEQLLAVLERADRP